MSYVLKRPMFRLGGQSADGVGITSGFNRRNYSNGKYGEQIEETIEKITEKPKFGTDELIAEAYRTVGGASDWKDWIKQGSDRALEIQEERKAKPYTDLDALIKAQSEETDFLKATTDPQTQARLGLLTEVTTMINQWKANNPNGTIEDFLKTGNQLEIDAKIRGANPSFPGIARILQLVEDDVNQRIADGKRSGNPIDDITLRKGAVEKVRTDSLKRRLGIYLSIGNAYGGRPRVARQFGNPEPTLTQGNLTEGATNLDLTEQIQTPTGDVSMTEDVSMGQEAPGGDDPYVMLRARLPQEIPDDVVRLIAYNPEAFADFAAIETQEDVMAFNQKYSVELIVNTDEV